MGKEWVISFLFCMTAVAVGGSRRKYYIAAVLEHHRLGDPEVDGPQEIVQKNMNVYSRAVQVAKNKGADIIVFPELGLFPYSTREEMKPYMEEIPDPNAGNYTPCDQPEEYANRTTLLTLSCLAKHNNIFLVANVGDIQPCTGSGCRADGVYQYNTNVVFSREGTLRTRYHKVHLFYEDATDSPTYPQSPEFVTDFGTFATYICFDVWYKDIVESSKQVDNIAFPTMWFNTMPILNSVQVWEAFSLTNNVNFLAANIQLAGYGNTGSGIFTPGQGAIKYTLNNDALSKLVVSKVPLSRSDVECLNNPQPSITVITENGTTDYSSVGEGSKLGSACDDRVLGESNNLDLDYRCLHDDIGNYTFVKLTQNSDALQLCQNGMCCSLRYSTNHMRDHFYLGVHNQTYSAAGRYSWCLEACIVLRCESFGDRACGTSPLKSQTVFTRLELKANFTTKYVYPSVLENNMRIATLEKWSHSIEEVEVGEVSGQLSYGSDSRSPMVVAALAGRCYDRDPPYVP